MVSSGSPPSSESRPEATRTNPTTMRKSEDFPAPLRPRIARLSPEATEKFTPAKTSRPPRRQARSVAESRINNASQQPAQNQSARYVKAAKPGISGMLSND